MTDPRVTLRRPALAPCDEEGVATADAYVKLRRARTIALIAPLRASPDPGAEQVSQLLLGERFDLLRQEAGFAWGQARRDGYVGWVGADSLSDDLAEPTHWAIVPRAPILTRPQLRSPCWMTLDLNALVTIEDECDGFLHVGGLGWAPSQALAPIGSGFRDPVASADLFVGAPYVWGGRGSPGLDCSGLIQQLLFAAGQACPRDADQQAALGVEVAEDALEAGDLVAWRGHIGMMLDAERLIHANAHHMAVAVEPLETAIERIAATTTGRPTAFRRLDHGLIAPSRLLAKSGSGLLARPGGTLRSPSFP